MTLPGLVSLLILPYVDFIVAILLVFPSTRSLAAMLYAVLQFIGVILRLREDRNAAPDLALCPCSVFLMLGCLLAW